jgi:plastocyanin
VERDAILLGPAERADVLVDFAGRSGQTLYLESVPDTGSTSLLGTGRLARTEPVVQPIMEFRIGAESEDPTVVPAALRPLPDWVQEASSTPQRVFAFGFGPDEQGRPSWTINGRTFDHDRVDARVEIGSVETWMLANTSVGMSHYIHLHDADWILLSRNGRAPTPGEAGMKETFRLDPGEVAAIAARFSDHLGRFMFHCHMLEHEDHGMMGVFEVVPEGQGDAPPPLDPGELPNLPGLPDPPEPPDELPQPPEPGGIGSLVGGAQIVASPSGTSGGFLPATAYHGQGEVAQLTNLDNNVHDITSNGYLVPGVRLFQSDLASFGQTVPVTRTDQLAPGRYGYHCSLHPSMTGELVVD